MTAAGRYAVVVYAPEQAGNMAQAQGVLGRAAIVNLRTGAVRELGGGFSIAYFDPGCGTGSQAVLTRGDRQHRADQLVELRLRLRHRADHQRHVPSAGAKRR